MNHPSEHDFTGTVDNWEERVFLNAAYFRIHRFYGRAEHDSCETKTFPDAIRRVGAARCIPGARVLVYAITASGRFTALPEGHWLKYLGLVQVA